MSEKELLLSYQNRTLLKQTDLKNIEQLWKNYRQNNLAELKLTAEIFVKQFPFILNAVKAHIERIPVNGNQGRPVQTLNQILKDIKTNEFAAVFKEFCKREEIYGYGDWQVKKMLETITKSKKNE